MLAQIFVGRCLLDEPCHLLVNGHGFLWRVLIVGPELRSAELLVDPVEHLLRLARLRVAGEHCWVGWKAPLASIND